MKFPHALIAAIVAVVVGGLVFVFVQVGGSDGPGLKVGAPVACAEESPECLPVVPFIDRDGKMWDAEQLAGKVVVINVWATWCKPCRVEMPELVELRNHYSTDDVVLLGVMRDSPSEATLNRFMSTHEVNYPIVPINSELDSALDYPSGIPATFIYDRSGYLVERKLGGVTMASLRRVIDDSL